MEEGQTGSDLEALTGRIEAAIARINSAAQRLEQGSGEATPSSAKVTALVNQHEAMREEVAGTLRDLDKIISKLEI